MKGPKKKTRKPAPVVEYQPTGKLARTYLQLLMVATVFSFYPLLRYFFAQDDFILMHIVQRDGLSAFTDFFARETGHFRPLTKAAYFGLMHRLFGLDAAPWHNVSMFLHIINSILYFLLLGRTGVKTASALITTSLFALSLDRWP